MCYITVCTPTYNRAGMLERPFESLRKQSFRDFEWLIIDDGSTDNTEKVVEKFKKIANFTIRYYKKENGGRHTALNYSYKFIKSKYVINLDSDDELTSNALQILYDTWEGMSDFDRERCWCVTGRCVDNTTGKIIGVLWPSEINSLSGRKQHKKITKFKRGCEMSCCRKTEVLKKFPFPVYSDTKFVSENQIWEKINQEYDQYCTNEILRIYHTDSQDSLGGGKCIKKVEEQQCII